MILDRKHIPWALITGLLAVGFIALYLANFHPESLPFTLALPAWFGEVPPRRGSVGGSPYGLTLGILAAVIFLFAASLGVRRRRPTLKVGRLQTWLRAHIWFSLLTVPLIVMHSGVSIGGPMTMVLLMVYGIVMLSGLYGLAIQQVLPRLMKVRVPMETIFEQIPHVLGLMREEAEAIRGEVAAVEKEKPKPVKTTAEGGSEPAEPAEEETPSEPELDESRLRLMSFLDEQVIPYLSIRRGTRHPLNDQRTSAEAFRILKVSVEEVWHPQIETLQARVDERRQLDLQARMHHWMHGWLFVHVPATLLLLILTGWHAIVTLIYY